MIDFHFPGLCWGTFMIESDLIIYGYCDSSHVLDQSPPCLGLLGERQARNIPFLARQIHGTPSFVDRTRVPESGT
jgi:hypothetical protein